MEKKIKIPKKEWEKITREDVIQAIDIFIREQPKYKKPTNTFMVYKGMRLPGKRIRKMAYEVHYGRDISVYALDGGKDTDKFFRNLNFNTLYNGEFSKRSEEMELSHEADQKLINCINNSDDIVLPKKFEYSGKSMEVEEPEVIDGIKIYKRNKRKALNAIVHAEFFCEIDRNNVSFISCKTKKRYMEPHHLVPLAFQDYFQVSLDVEENIVSLCSNCHNEIHYGENAKLLIEKLFEKRKKLLLTVGIEIELEELLQMYRIR